MSEPYFAAERGRNKRAALQAAAITHAVMGLSNTASALLAANNGENIDPLIEAMAKQPTAEDLCEQYLAWLERG